MLPGYAIYSPLCCTSKSISEQRFTAEEGPDRTLAVSSVQTSSPGSRQQGKFSLKNEKDIVTKFGNTEIAGCLYSA